MNITYLIDIAIEQSLMSLARNTFTILWYQLVVIYYLIRFPPDVDMNEFKKRYDKTMSIS
jgi:hypothetical protein